MAGSGRNNGKKTIYSSKVEVKNTPGVYGGDRQKRKELRFSKRRKRQKQLKFGAILALVAVIGIIIFVNVRHNAMDVTVDGESIAFVKSGSATGEDIINTVTAQIVDEVGTNIQINEEVLFTPVHKNGKNIIPVEDALIIIKNAVTYKVEATVITVDGGEVLAMAKQEEAQALLDEIIAEYVPEGSNIVEKGFVEDVKTVKKFVDSSSIITVDEARAKLTEGTSAKREYTVVSGDTLSKIASKNNITVEDLLAANPGITISTTLNIGDKLSLEVMVPFISVKTAENMVFTEKQEKGVEYRQDNTKPVSYKKVIQQGVDGQKDVTTQIIRVNGFETEQKVVSETTTVEPVPEIILVGTL